MDKRPAAKRDGKTEGASPASLETSFLLSVFAELSGRPRPPGPRAAGPSDSRAPASDGAPSGT